MLGCQLSPCARADRAGCAPAQLGVFHFAFPGVIKLAGGAFEAVVVYVYIKGVRHEDTVTFRGFMFAQARGPRPARAAAGSRQRSSGAALGRRARRRGMRAAWSAVCCQASI